MLIKCIGNKGSFLPKMFLTKHFNFTEKTNFPLILSKNYVVYAMTVNSGYIWYYICDEHAKNYPIWNPSVLFEVIDSKISKYWIYTCYFSQDRQSFSATWAYPEWAMNEYTYYDRLSDGEKEETNIFKKYKELMDIEFPLPSIPEAASALDEEWLMCHFCLDAWQSISKDGMVICPKCKRMMHNPRYPGRHDIK